MLRTALGPAIARLLEDPVVVRYPNNRGGYRQAFLLRQQRPVAHRSCELHSHLQIRSHSKDIRGLIPYEYICKI